ncbi:MAG: hypothetical protein ACO1OT_18925 [Heyndrickxia sp.]
MLKKSEVLSMYREVKRRRAVRSHSPSLIGQRPKKGCGCGGSVKRG